LSQAAPAVVDLENTPYDDLIIDEDILPTGNLSLVVMICIITLTQKTKSTDVINIVSLESHLDEQIICKG
jgi:hypothetical protein